MRRGCLKGQVVRGVKQGGSFADWRRMTSQMTTQVKSHHTSVLIHAKQSIFNCFSYKLATYLKQTNGCYLQSKFQKITIV